MVAEGLSSYERRRKHPQRARRRAPHRGARSAHGDSPHTVRALRGDLARAVRLPRAAGDDARDLRQRAAAPLAGAPRRAPARTRDDRPHALRRPARCSATSCAAASAPTIPSLVLVGPRRRRRAARARHRRATAACCSTATGTTTCAACAIARSSSCCTAAVCAPARCAGSSSRPTTPSPGACASSARATASAWCPWASPRARRSTSGCAAGARAWRVRAARCS